MRTPVVFAALLAAGAVHASEILDYTGPIMTGTESVVSNETGNTLSTSNITMQFTASLTIANGSVTAFNLDGGSVPIVSIGNTAYFDLEGDGPGGVITLPYPGPITGASVTDANTYPGGTFSWAFGTGVDTYFSANDQDGGTEVVYENLSGTGGSWVAVPELDWSHAVVGLTLLAGVALVLKSSNRARTV